MQALEKQFETQLESRSTGESPLEDLQNVANEYAKVILVVQTEMEKSLGQLMAPDVVLYEKRNKRHTLATIKHLNKTQIIPEGIDFNASNSKASGHHR